MASQINPEGGFRKTMRTVEFFTVYFDNFKKLVLTNFRNLLINFIYKLEKNFAIQQLIYLIELFIKDEEFINYTESMFFGPV